MWSVDFPNAYKTAPLHMNSREAAQISYLAPATNVPLTAEILAQPFGIRMAPANWGIVVTFIQLLDRGLLRLMVASFADDIV